VEKNNKLLYTAVG